MRTELTRPKHFEQSRNLVAMWPQPDLLVVVAQGNDRIHLGYTINNLQITSSASAKASKRSNFCFKVENSSESQSKTDLRLQTRETR